MPTLETGKSSAGYTLLEVIAVLALIGLITALAVPRIYLSSERVAVGYIGRMIQADFRQVKDESITDPQAEIRIYFTKDGYSFAIGEHSITRSFHYQFAFQLQKTELTAENSSPTMADAAPMPPDNPETDAASINIPAVLQELRFINGELSSGEFQLQWQTSNFQGSLLCKKDGTVEWRYQARENKE